MNKVSIIVPIYNVAEYLDTCIKSLVGQTYSDIEIILVDDGSIDDSPRICDEWSMRDNRIKVVHQQNQGVSVARNKGVEIASGEWIAFVDGDDYAADSMIEILLKETRKDEDIDLVMGGYYVDKNHRVIKEHFFKGNRIIKSVNKDELVKMAIGMDMEGLSGATNIGVPWAKLYKKDKICENNLEFPVGLKRMQDTVFNIAFFRIANEIRYIDTPIYFYRVWEESSVKRYSEDFEFTAQEIVEALEKEIYLYKEVKDKKAIIQYKKILLLIEVIRLTYIHKRCKLTLRQKIKNVKRLCESSFYHSAIRDTSNLYMIPKHIFLKKILKLKLFWLAYAMLWVKYHYNLLK